LFKVSGITGKTSDGDEEEEAEAAVAESSRRALGEVLGSDRRDRILATLYLVRQDSVLVVRQSCVQIWKALVHNTPKTGELRSNHDGCSTLNLSPVREILPVLLNQIIFLISSDEPEQQEVSVWRCRLPSKTKLTTSRPLEKLLAIFPASSENGS
jgi:hypothetical protein